MELWINCRYIVQRTLWLPTERLPGLVALRRLLIWSRIINNLFQSAQERLAGRLDGTWNEDYLRWGEVTLLIQRNPNSWISLAILCVVAYRIHHRRSTWCDERNNAEVAEQSCHVLLRHSTEDGRESRFIFLLPTYQNLRNEWQAERSSPFSVRL